MIRRRLASSAKSALDDLNHHANVARPERYRFVDGPTSPS